MRNCGGRYDRALHPGARATFRSRGAFVRVGQGTLPWMSGLSWEHFADAIGRRLAKHGYAQSSITLYKRMLRHFGAWVRFPPPLVSAQDLKGYLYHLSEREFTPQWIAQHVSLFRLTWDRLQGQSWTSRLSGPRYSPRMAEVMAKSEVSRCLAATRTLSERLALGLIYGACLKPEELRHLRWADIDARSGEMRVSGGGRRGGRRVLLPRRLVKLVESCQAFGSEGYVIPGRHQNCPMSRRGLTAMIARVGRRAKVDKALTAKGMRYTSAVHALESGGNLRDVCESMGYTRVGACARLVMALSPSGSSPVERFSRSRH